MSFLNLSLGELLGLAGAISAGVVALYLLDRSKRKQVVSTLRFWSGAGVRTQLKHRRRIQQPWSLLLEIISLLLLLAAIAGPRFGIIGGPGRDHVLILDTSAWMGSLGSRGRQSTLLDDARDSARTWLHSLPRRDRVMLVRADALATPATAFESDFSVVEEAMRTSRPGSSALNLEQALEFAQQAQGLQSERAGEIVYAGAGRVSEAQADLTNLPSNLRVLLTGAPQEDVGLRKIGLRRSPSAPDAWDIFVAVHNYGSKPHAVDLELQFGKSPVGQQRLQLAPGAEQQASFSYKTTVGGYLEARLNIKDAFAQDDRALIELPAQALLHIVVYSKEPQLLRPLITSNPQVDAVFEDPSKYDPAVKADVVVLDRFAPPMPPHADSIWIEPPADGSPIPVRETKTGVRLQRWNAESALGAGLRTQEVVLESAEVFTPAQGDEVVAESSDGPLVVARDVKGTKLAVLGFHPGRASMKYQIATPLLTANILKWMAPETFRTRDVQAGTVGTVSIPLPKDADPAKIRVLDEDQRPLPFTIVDGSLQFFSGAPGAVTVAAGDRETVYSLTLPDVAEAAWRVPANVRRGVPRAGDVESPPQDVWPWLAMLGGLGLLADWLLFGRSRLFRLTPGRAVPEPSRDRQRKAS
jgi:Aerotolerance regulator N-terminal/von Willebrand factor type A domain